MHTNILYPEEKTITTHFRMLAFNNVYFWLYCSVKGKIHLRESKRFRVSLC
jgi:hypothetical protein